MLRRVGVVGVVHADDRGNVRPQVRNNRLPLRFEGLGCLPGRNLVPHRADVKPDLRQRGRQFLGIASPAFQRIQSRLVEHEILIHFAAQLLQGHGRTGLAAEVRLLHDEGHVLDEHVRGGVAQGDIRARRNGDEDGGDSDIHQGTSNAPRDYRNSARFWGRHGSVVLLLGIFSIFFRRQSYSQFLYNNNLFLPTYEGLDMRPFLHSTASGVQVQTRP